jgi:release factor glutamine methyltransferase
VESVGKSLHDRLVAAGIDFHEAHREVQMILEHVTGLSAAQQYLQSDAVLAPEAVRKIEEIAAKREQRIPLQYCLGEAWFMGLKFHVRSGVLIPRADTETLVETALKFLKPVKTPLIVDVGTGSGAIAIAMAKFREDLHAVALDVSEEALAIASENAELHSVSDRIQFVLADWLTYKPDARFNAVLSNPPYIPSAKAGELQPEVSVHEPKLALFGFDEDGLGFYRNLSRTSPDHLLDRGFIAVEVGHGQADAVSAIFRTGAWIDQSVHYDLNKIPRVLSAFRP